jgi:hypothetical protein
MYIRTLEKESSYVDQSGLFAAWELGRDIKSRDVPGVGVGAWESCDVREGSGKAGSDDVQIECDYGRQSWRFRIYR